MNNKQKMAIRQAITDIFLTEGKYEDLEALANGSSKGQVTPWQPFEYGFDYFDLLDQIDTAYSNVLRAVDDGSDDLPSVWVEFGGVVYEFNPSEADEWQSDGNYDYHYNLDDNSVCVYRVVNNDTDVTSVIHTQKIKP